MQYVLLNGQEKTEMERTVTPVRTGVGDSNGDGTGVEFCGGAGDATARDPDAAGQVVWVAGGGTPELVRKEPLGRFWSSFSDLESEDEADHFAGASGEEGPALASPSSSPPARATLGSFIARAAELGGLSPPSAVGGLRPRREGIPFPGCRALLAPGRCFGPTAGGATFAGGRGVLGDGA
jgi:hypothetical protein